MPTSLRQAHRDATRRRIVTAARKVFVRKGYAGATVEQIITAAGVSRATLYAHFDSKFALLTAAAERLVQESNDAARRVAGILVAGDRDELRQWVAWALDWYVRNRPMALAAQEAELSASQPADVLGGQLACVEPWVRTWPAARQPEARMRFALCRLQMHHYMWGNSSMLFGDDVSPVDVFTEIWWSTLKAADAPDER